jgi:hypothetical protein
MRLIEVGTKEELLSLSRNTIKYISKMLSPENFTKFLVAKNVKIYNNDINNYIDDFFNKNTINIIIQNNLVSEGVINILLQMNQYPRITNKNKNLINQGLKDLGYIFN